MPTGLEEFVDGILFPHGEHVKKFESIFGRKVLSLIMFPFSTLGQVMRVADRL